MPEYPRLERSYVQPDPQFPLPRIWIGEATGLGMECADDSQLERWRVSNIGCDDWMCEFGESPDSWSI